MIETDQSEATCPIHELPERLQHLIGEAAATARPAFITNEGRPVAAVVDIGEFERLQRLAELAGEYREIIAAHDGPWLQHDAVWNELHRELEHARTAHGADGGSSATA